MSRTSAILLVTLLLASCFQEPPLPSCASPDDCPPELPLCREGRCFHYHLGFLRPLCTADNESGCCAPEEGLVAGHCRLWEEAGGQILGVFRLPGESPCAAAQQGSDLHLACYATDRDEASLVAAGKLNLGDEPVVDLRPWVAALPGRTFVVAANRDIVAVRLGPVPPEELHRTTLPAPYTGVPAACADGRLAAATPELLVFRDGDGNTSAIPLDVGQLPSTLGPVIDAVRDLVAVPVQDGAELRVGRVVDGAWSELFSLPQKELPGGLFGLAHDGSETLFALSAHGRIHALHLPTLAGTVQPALRTNNWSTPHLVGPVVAGPAVAQSGTLLFATTEGLFRVDKASRLQPELLAPAGDLSGPILPLRNHGFVVPAHGTDSTALRLRVDAESLPWLAVGVEPVSLSWPLTCPAAALSPGGDDGVALVACPEWLAAVVLPELSPVDAPWPTPRGPGTAACR